MHKDAHNHVFPSLQNNMSFTLDFGKKNAIMLSSATQTAVFQNLQGEIISNSIYMYDK